MGSLLVKDVDYILTLDDQKSVLSAASIYVEDGWIKQIGPSAVLPSQADQVLNLKGHIVLPGLVNTHHHMFQTLTRAVPAAQNAELFGWLKTLYPLWAKITPPMLKSAMKIAISELILSGCTTSSDHLYLYPKGCRLEDTMEIAKEAGFRFHAMYGSMSVGESAGGLPPDALVEDEDTILKVSQRLVEGYHDSKAGAMLRVGLAPCSPFSVSQDLMRETAKLARSYQVRLHTHLAENVHDIAYSKQKFHLTPAEYAEELGWVGPDVWHAHCVKLDTPGIVLFGRTHTGVAHCPCSNMRLASGIAPIRAMLNHKVPVGLGVDGSASNDSNHMLNEARQALLLARVGSEQPGILNAYDVLYMATRGGAQVLGREDIGSLVPGQAADFIAYELNQPALAGAADPLAALIFCQPTKVDYSIINGKLVVENGHFLPFNLRDASHQHNQLSHHLLNA